MTYTSGQKPMGAFPPLILVGKTTFNEDKLGSTWSSFQALSGN